MPDIIDRNVLQRSPLHDVHVRLGARMVPFSGFEMPVQYPTGIIKEHLATRTSAGLFDVSHMGQAYLEAADGRHETVAAALETLVPGDILSIRPGRQRYSQFVNSGGGILDDLMVSRPADPAEAGRLDIIVNAARKESDYAHLMANLPDGIAIKRRYDLALLALQGPKSAAVLAAHVPGAADMDFMETRDGSFDGIPVHLSRSGYTGEDGYEISVAVEDVERVWTALTDDERVTPAGLGARDSLRLEAGLCLYGHDLDDATSPVEAGLSWSIGKRRCAEANFPGAERILHEIEHGPSRLRVGIRPAGPAPAREGTAIVDSAGNGIGTLTSGGYGPTVGGPVAMGYIAVQHSNPGTPVQLIVRGCPKAAEVVRLPFVPPGFHRG